MPHGLEATEMHYAFWSAAVICRFTWMSNVTLPQSARGLAQSKTLPRGSGAIEMLYASWSAAVICRFTWMTLTTNMMVSWTSEIHVNQGYVAVADGSVHHSVRQG
jgi:hypothetical protein